MHADNETLIPATSLPALHAAAGSVVRCTKECPNRYPYRRAANQGEDMKRPVYLCKLRDGFMLKHWKCVGLTNPECPINPQNASVEQPAPTKNDENR